LRLLTRLPCLLDGCHQPLPLGFRPLALGNVTDARKNPRLVIDLDDLGGKEPYYQFARPFPKLVFPPHHPVAL
jgi:hypothetical protein